VFGGGGEVTLCVRKPQERESIFKGLRGARRVERVSGNCWPLFPESREWVKRGRKGQIKKERGKGTCLEKKSPCHTLPEQTLSGEYVHTPTMIGFELGAGDERCGGVIPRFCLEEKMPYEETGERCYFKPLQR